MIRSKKGFTLVELIICCAVMVMLAGACTAVLAAGGKLFTTGTKSAATQMDVSLLQTSLLNQLPSTQKIESKDVSSLRTTENASAEVAIGTAVFFNDEGVFTIWHNEKNTTIEEITGFTYTVSKIGTGENPRTQLSYTATFKNGATYSGGLALSTMCFNDLALGEGITTATYHLKGTPETVIVAGSSEVDQAIVFQKNTGS